MRAFLFEHDLAAVNTLFAESAGWTWTGSRGHKHRIDYVLWSRERLSMITNVWVSRDIELADSERDDHCLVVSTACIQCRDQRMSENANLQRLLVPRLCRSKLADPQLQQQFSNWVWTFRADHDENVDQHLEQLQKHIREGADMLRAPRAKPNKSWISDISWALMRRRSTTKKTMRNLFAAVKHATMQLYFLAWCVCRPRVFSQHHRYAD